MRFPPHFLDEIRDRVPISEIVGTRVTFDRKKSNVAKGDHWACCPFHGEKSPSFHCEDRKGRYYCFGCGASGDHFRFLTESGGMNFPEAVERVAEMAGVPMPARDPEAEKRAERRGTLTDAMELAAAFFEEQLQGPGGAHARAYLRDRGLTHETVRRFRLGHAPNSRNALKEHLAGKGVDRARIEACGLVVHGPDIAVSYDRFRDRLMFPIQDAKGRVIAFGGRALSADVPAKYLNSPETELFHKSDVLYHHGPAREAARKAGTLIAVEGYMDVIALAQAGIGHAVAPLGTALTDRQMALMWRAAPEPVLCFDGDEAGRRAMGRAIDTALPSLGPGRTLRFAALPPGQDPDDLIRSGGREAFEAVIKGARTLSDALWSREVEGRVHDTPERRAALERTFRDTVRAIRDEDVRRHYEQDMRERVAAAFGTAKGEGRGERRGARGGGRGKRDWREERQSVRSGRVVVSDALSRRLGTQPTATLREATLMGVAVNHPAAMAEEYDTVAEIAFNAPAFRAMQSALLDIHADGEPDGATAVHEALRARGHGGALDALDAQLRGARMWPALPGAHKDDALDCFAQAMHLYQRASVLQEELRLAREAMSADIESADEAVAAASYQRILDLQREIANVANVEALLEGFGEASGRTGAA